ncbi:MAG: M1 family aminopeptidase [Hyphomonas sp.]
MTGWKWPGTFTSGITDGLARIDFDAPLPSGVATLVMEYTAPYDRNLAGLYKVEQAGRPYLVTQMEAYDARKMFVSFDEPRFKTPYSLTVTAPVGMAIAANGALEAKDDAEGGMVRYTFKTTRPIQSYLVALMVGPYDSMTAAPIPASDLRAEPIPLRGFAAAGKGAQLRDALDVTDEMVDWQETYFDYPYPYGKLDLIAAADFAYGAMENAGAIVYREAALLIDDKTSLARRRAIYSTHAQRTGAPAVRQSGDARLVGRYLAERGSRHLDGDQDDERRRPGRRLGSHPGVDQPPPPCQPTALLHPPDP